LGLSIKKEMSADPNFGFSLEDEEWGEETSESLLLPVDLCNAVSLESLGVEPTGLVDSVDLNEIRLISSSFIPVGQQLSANY